MTSETDATGSAKQWIAFRDRDSAALLGCVARSELFPGEIQETRQVLAEQLEVDIAQIRIQLELGPPA